jgi:hypothetical protein
MNRIGQAKSQYVYRINAKDARMIDCRENRPGQRWRVYRLLPTPEDARSTILRLRQGKGWSEVPIPRLVRE